ncbi:hypothetical protein [Aliidiomarina haloalkalitolerans]|uniref:Uncharacterized protein n=1 Tax=Aliidiomarina haloalkalitolerans TaxID=859059 RepID=A0A432VYU9_9GAMM|nr:hypothetical protein [Aliidiomarina haloalkalitolerans]RUO21828.1 hypothetical protein CWE06_02975 [Aliidiomarina haloalkalitolerans]
MRREIYPEELGFFYRATGEAIWQLQYVEDALCKFYIMYCVHFNCDCIDRNNAKKKLAKISKLTIGHLIRLLENTGQVQEKMLLDLKEFNSLRKWVVHNSMRENGEDLYTDQGREQFANKVLAFTDMARSIHKGICDSLMHLVTTTGCATEQQIMETAYSEIDRLKGNE